MSMTKKKKKRSFVRLNGSVAGKKVYRKGLSYNNDRSDET